MLDTEQVAMMAGLLLEPSDVKLLKPLLLLQKSTIEALSGSSIKGHDDCLWAIRFATGYIPAHVIHRAMLPTTARHI
jgi:hypothetical protein